MLKNKMKIILTLSAILMLTNPASFSWELWKLKTTNDVLNLPSFVATSSKLNLLSTMMILTVTALVMVYSESYMEGYDNKKFIILLLSFFWSMFLLIWSNSLMTFMISWEYLGLSSLLLIMFYPNKTTMYNSIMTMIFNRTGDIFLMLVLSYFLMNPNKMISLLNTEFYAILMLLILCSFTKSAQLPFSSWLPAAMSAPTPISAMVHSSTLVTAGVMMIYKINHIFLSSIYSDFVFLMSSMTFIMGGILACGENDLKKMIAFSTMSQISMIMLFNCMEEFYYSLTHVISHALFKTLLFCSAGLLFSMNFSDQKFSEITSFKLKMFLKSIMFISLFSMSGLIWSSSFFTKHTMIENLLQSSKWLNFMFLMLGSIITIIYSSKMMSKTSTTKKSNKKVMISKNYFSFFFFFFSMTTIFFIYLLNNVLNMSMTSFLSKAEIMIVTTFIVLPTLKPISNKMLVKFGLSKSVFLMKSLYSMNQEIMNFSILKEKQDTFFFKSFYMKYNQNPNIPSLNYYMFLIVPLCLEFMM